MKITQSLLTQLARLERLWVKRVTPARVRLAKRLILLGGFTLLGLVIVGGIWYFRTHTVALFATEGPVAHRQRDLMFFALALSLIVIVPVFIMLALIIWRYRDSNTKGKYSPKLAGNRMAELIWWGIPSILIIILSVVTWHSSHELDPYKPLQNPANTKPITIQVVALQWKWLFIYPEQGIATVNYLQFPEKTPVNFQITADAPMNSFWIPQLGGQVYAMSGMTTKLHLMADHTGTYRGSSANISGEGFAGMKFDAHSSSAQDFTQWVRHTQQSSPRLTTEIYDTLVRPSKEAPVTLYSSPDAGLFDTIVMKYMTPQQDTAKVEER